MHTPCRFRNRGNQACRLPCAHARESLTFCNTWSALCPRRLVLTSGSTSASPMTETCLAQRRRFDSSLRSAQSSFAICGCSRSKQSCLRFPHFVTCQTDSIANRDESQIRSTPPTVGKSGKDAKTPKPRQPPEAIHRNTSLRIATQPHIHLHRKCAQSPIRCAMEHADRWWDHW